MMAEDSSIQDTKWEKIQKTDDTSGIPIVQREVPEWDKAAVKLSGKKVAELPAKLATQRGRLLNIATARAIAAAKVEGKGATNRIALWTDAQKIGSSSNFVVEGVFIKAPRFKSVDTANPPLEVASNLMVANLNADMVDGQHATGFASAAHTHPLTDIQQSGATTNQVPKWSGTQWQAGNVDWAEVTNKPSTFPPSAHQTSHQSGGSDALTGNLDANARVAVAKAATLVGTRREINFIEGSNVTITVADDATNEKVDVTIAAGASGLTMPSGYLVKSYDPPLQYYDDGYTTLQSYDVGASAHILPLRYVLPPAVATAGTVANPGIRFVFHDATTLEFQNTDTTAGLTKLFEDLITDIATVNGRSIQKVEFFVFAQNDPVIGPEEVDLGVFEFKGWVAPRGTGAMP